MTNHDYRWQDFVIRPRPAVADLIASLLVIGLLSGAALAGPSHKGQPGQAALEQAALKAEQAPPLARSARRL
jgi:hypothetical protein